MASEITRRDAIQTLTVGGLTIALSGCQTTVDVDLDEFEPEPPMQSATREQQQASGTGRFTVTIDGVEVGGFRHVTIPSSTTEEGEYREGSEPDYERKLWGQTTFDDLEMERGFVPGDTVIRDWRDDVLEGRVDEGLKEVAVTLLSEDGQSRVEWRFSNAWIKAYDPPELDASADGEVATESCTVAFDRMVRTES